MRSRLRNLKGALLIAAASLLACTGGDKGGSERVVCVSKQINEFMYDIGAQGVLVARDLTSVYPAEIKKLPSVGYHRALSAEGIISMKPTLFLTDGNVGPDAVIEQVKKVGIPVEVMKPGGTADSAQALMAALGKRFHREKAADSVIAKWKSDIAAIASDTSKAGTRPRVLIMHFGQIANNYLAVSRGSVGDAVVQMAGGTNAVDSSGRMLRLTPELIAKAAPDIIIATDVGFDRVGSAEKFAQLPGVNLTPAGKSGRVYRIDEADVMYYSPRTPDAVRRIAAFIHPATP